MKNVRKPVCLTSIAMLIAMLFLGSITISPVAAATILYTPINTTVPVEAGQTFVLGFQMEFDNLTELGYFSTTLFWDNNGTENLNFTYVGYSITPDPFGDQEDVTVKRARPYGYPAGYYRYTVQICATYGEATNTPFWVNVTMGAYGLKSGAQIPHRTGEYNITIVKVRCYEYAHPSVGPGDVTINVTGYYDAEVTSVIDYDPHHGPIGSPLKPVKWAHQTWDLKIDVTIKNTGTLTISLDAKAYYSIGGTDYLIGTLPISNLAPGASITKTFTWTGLPKQSTLKTYTLKGKAVLGGSVIDERAGNTVKVMLIGDTDADGACILDDLINFGALWVCTSYTSPGYWPWADFDNTGFAELSDLIDFGAAWTGGPFMDP